MKKEKSPVLVILTIFFLALFIILPPVFRKLVPKEEKKTPVSKLTLVICNKTYSNEFYRVNSKTRFNSDGTITNTITYSKINDAQITQDTEQVQENATNEVEEELTYFKSIPNLDIVDSNDGTNTSTIVTINQSEVEDHPTEGKLISYLNDTPESQKKFYQDLGYVCNIVES